MWKACPDCGFESWSQLRGGKQRNVRCRVCNGKCHVGKEHTQWRGGATVDREGYVRVRIYPDDPFFSMGHRIGAGEAFYVYEHRLIVAKLLGRCLSSLEPVHHKNGIKGDNRPENLELLPNALAHLPDTELRRYVVCLEDENRTLKDRILVLENSQSFMLVS